MLAMNYFAIVFIHFHVLVTFIITTSCLSAQLHTCPGPHEPIPKGRFATKTSYSATYKSSPDAKFSDDTCQGEPQQLWLLTRHGTRYPVKRELQQMGATLPVFAEEIVFNHENGRGCLSDNDIEELKNFAPPYDLIDSGQLHPAGADEQFELGKDWKQHFAQLFKQPYNEDVYKVEFTTSNRTGQSAYHFLRGVFGDEAVARIKLPKPRTPNFKLRAYHSCPVWQQTVLRGDATRQQQRLYERHAEFREVVEAVSARLGYPKDISAVDLSMIYEECRYEIAWYPDRPSIWCKAFTPMDIEVLEYHQALKYYYEDSYGGPELNAQIACATVADLRKRFRDAVAGAPSPRVLLYFSHDKMLLQLFTLLHLYRPAQPLQHDNRADHEGGPFAISSLVPFSSNFAFVLYKCADESHRVGALLQGVPVSLSPLCPHEESSTCSWPVQHVEHVADTCRVRELCHEHDEL